MLVIPAIDIKDGKVVRLYKGEYDKDKVYSKDPVVVANRWQRRGAKLIHVVDLDGAVSGKSKNLDVIEKIVASVDIPIELGGGIRTKEAIRNLLNKGVNKVILGTKACENETFLQSVVEEFGDKIIVSIDVLEGKVATKAWTKVTEIKPFDLLKRLELLGVKVVIYTEIDRDGTLKGPDIEAIKEFLQARESCLVIASGGVSSLDDLKALKTLEPQGLFGVIVGKALYEKRIELEEAIAVC